MARSFLVILKIRTSSGQHDVNLSLRFIFMAMLVVVEIFNVDRQFANQQPRVKIGCLDCVMTILNTYVNRYNAKTHIKFTITE